jgi:hypothetical protein
MSLASLDPRALRMNSKKLADGEKLLARLKVAWFCSQQVSDNIHNLEARGKS